MPPETHRRLAAATTAFRIGDPAGRHPIWSDGGARLTAGRWHEAGDPVIYASEHYSTAMLEKLIYFQGDLPQGQHFVQITIPAGVSYEVFAPHQAPGWALAGSIDAAAFGHAWAQEQRSVLLFVPSVVAPLERNILFSTTHPEFPQITVGLETPVHWDQRLIR